MSWLLPGFLAGALLIGLPILLHFLRSKPKTSVLFPSLRFLGQTAIRDTRRHRLQRWITLLLRCLIFGALAAAFARPFWAEATAARHSAMVIAIDNSMSMQADGRWPEMLRWTAQWVDGLQPGDRAGILMMNPAPNWLLPMTDNLDAVRTALETARPGFEKTRYGPALKTAAEALAATPGSERTLVWMADEQRAGWLGVDLNQPLPGGIKVHLSDPIPTPKRQAAIIRLEPAFGTGETAVSAIVRQFAPDIDKRKLTAAFGSQVIAEQTITLHAGDNKISIPLGKDTNPKWLRISLDADALPADDTAWIALGNAEANRIFLDKAASPDFLTHALRSTRRLGAAGFNPQSLAEQPWPIEIPVILRSASAFASPELENFLNAGGAVWIFADGFSEQTAWLEKHGIHLTARDGANSPWNLRDWDSTHPILAAYAGQSLLPLLEIEFARGYNLAGEALRPIANWPDGQIALAEWSVDGRRALVAGFPMDREATNWPAQPSFVPFVHQAARWLADSSTNRRDWRVGESIPLPAEEGLWRVVDSPAPPKERKVAGSVRPTAPGLFEFSAGSLRKLYAVNTPAEESDLAPWPESAQLLAIAGSALPPQPAEIQEPAPFSREISEAQQRLWWWFFVLCAAAILAELAIANRTAV